MARGRNQPNFTTQWTAVRDLFLKGAEASVEALRAIPDADELGKFAVTWYADPSPDARRLSAARADRNDAARFARAEGVIEVAIDAGKANATGGWRDVKVAVISGRTPGKPASAGDGENRELPAPTVVVVAASVEGSGAFAERVRAETDRPGATAAADVTVPADGAEWIRNLAEAVLPQAAGVSDFCHAAEHLADAVTAVREPGGTRTDCSRAVGRRYRRAARRGWRGGSGRRFWSCRRGATGNRCGVWRRMWPRTPSTWVTRVGWRRVGASGAVRWRGR